MPFEWKTAQTPKPRAQPLAELHAWPYRSLSKRGFAAFMGLSFLLLALPLSGLIGNVALWFVLLPIALTFGGVWWALQRSYSDGETIEVLRIWPDRTELVHQQKKGTALRWQANTHWVRTSLVKDQPIENYLTLSGGEREVSLGAFLTPQERAELYFDLNYHLDQAVQTPER